MSKINYKYFYIFLIIIFGNINLCIGQNTPNSFSIIFDAQYSFMEYGKLHGINVPVGFQLKSGKNVFQTGIGVGYGISNWNFSNHPNKNYNLDINSEVPPYATFNISTFQDIDNLKLKGVTGHAHRIFGYLSYGREIKIKEKTIFFNIGGYFNRVNTSFTAGYLENQTVFNPLVVDDSGDPILFESELLIPIWVVYYEFGPFANIKKLLFEDWKVPMGISLTYYHGFNNNGWYNFGVYFDLGIANKN